MKAKEAAELVSAEGELDAEELLFAAKLLSRHVLASEGDPELQTAVSTVHLAEMAQQHKRYKLILELVKADDDEGRALLERSLDAEIDRRERRIIQ